MAAVAKTAKISLGVFTGISYLIGALIGSLFGNAAGVGIPFAIVGYFLGACLRFLANQRSTDEVCRYCKSNLNEGAATCHRCGKDQ